jgi:hypothetical protein
MNAFSKVHDLLMNKLPNLSGPTWFVANFGSMPIAMAFSDIALLGGELAPLNLYLTLKK